MSLKSVAVSSALGTAALATAALAGAAPAQATPAAPPPTGSTAIHQYHQHGKLVTSFELARAAGVVKAGCLPHARAKVKITSGGEAEDMQVWVSGLPKKTEFDFFVLQVPDAPFGLSWYQGDIDTDKYGRGYAKFRGRFNVETFTVAVGSAPAPVTHDGLDANTNPATKPVHQYHLGFWFNSPADAAKAGCGDLVTPFNGDHNAGTQAMSTRQFAPEDGPLGHIPS